MAHAQLVCTRLFSPRWEGPGDEAIHSSTQDHYSTHTRLGKRFSTSGPCNTLLRTSTQYHHSTQTRLGEKHKTILVMFLSLNSMYFPTHPCMNNVIKTIAVLPHLPLSKNGRATVVADSSSIQDTRPAA